MEEYLNWGRFFRNIDWYEQAEKMGKDAPTKAARTTAARIIYFGLVEMVKTVPEMMIHDGEGGIIFNFGRKQNIYIDSVGGFEIVGVEKELNTAFAGWN